MPAERIGNGTHACFAIPGWGEDRNCYLPLVAQLGPGTCLYSVDPPGYGNTAPPPEYSFEAVAELLQREYEEASRLEGRPIDTLLGNCSGALFACELALRLDPAPRRLLLVDPFAFLPGYFRVFLRRDFGRHAYNSTFANPVGRWLTNVLASGREDRSTDMTQSFRSVDHEVTYRYLEMFGTHPGIDRFSSLDCEVRIATGERTFAAVKKSVQMWQDLWPHAIVTSIPACGHLPIREAPEGLCEALFSNIPVSQEVAR
ncbi:MAG: alpha/beta hydrolase [Planctomycetales bacterium]|nr:alpha/beta hydrolase [bacterium]UNM06989.1 MAG: alpha/beta hydrolase [Planctomycetales bacterium]